MYSLGATLFHLLLGCLATEISQHTGQARVVVGVPYPGQAVEGRHHLIGRAGGGGGFKTAWFRG